MAFSIQEQPTFFRPSLNELIYVVEPPTGVSSEGLIRYGCKASISLNDTLIATQIRQPNPNGWMIFDISQTVNSDLTQQFDINNLELYTFNNNSFKSVDVTFQGESEALSNFTITNSGGNMSVTSISNIGNDLSVNDEIIIVDSSVSDYNGRWVVNSITSPTQVVLNGTYVSNTSNGDGKAYKVGNEKWQLESLSADTIYSFNGGIDWYKYSDFDYEDYEYDSPSNKKLLVSTLDKAKTFDIDIDNHLWVNGFVDISLSSIEFNKIRVISNRGTFDYDNLLDDTGISYTGLEYKIGPKDLINTTTTATTISGTLPVIDNTTTEYTVRFYYDNGGSSTDYTFNIKDYCSKFDKYNILYLDEMGSYIPLTFNLRSVTKNKINRKNIRSKIGDYDGTSWGFKTTDKGLKTIYTNKDKTITINSDWVSEYMAGFIEDMISSTDVYVYDPVDMVYKGIVIKNTDYISKSVVNDKLINYTIDFEYSNKNRSRLG